MKKSQFLGYSKKEQAALEKKIKLMRMEDDTVLQSYYNIRTCSCFILHEHFGIATKRLNKIQEIIDGYLTDYNEERLKAGELEARLLTKYGLDVAEYVKRISWRQRVIFTFGKIPKNTRNMEMYIVRSQESIYTYFSMSVSAAKQIGLTAKQLGEYLDYMVDTVDSVARGYLTVEDMAVAMHDEFKYVDRNYKKVEEKAV